MNNARKLFVSLLLRAEREGYSNLLLNSALNGAELTEADKAFVTSAFYGVLERRKTLDYILNGLLKKPLSKTPPYTAAVLRAGAYQILYLTKIPESAAVNESVKLLRRSKEKGNAGLCNAVLRRLCGHSAQEFLQNANAAVRYSVEPWIITALAQDYLNWEAFLQNALCPPPVHIRLNTIAAPAAQTQQILAQNGVTLTPQGPSGCFKTAGLRGVECLQQQTGYGFFVQELASQLCAGFLQAQPGQRILDCCAAPGGKSFCTALNVQNKAEIISCDVHEHRVGLIQKNAERLGLTCIQPRLQNAAVYCKDLGLFDRVLCDVPCSGLGVMRRKPELKYKQQQECAALPPLQLQILTNAARYLKPGGRLIYSTCTVLKAENEKVVQAFLAANPQFCPLPLGGSLGEQSMHTYFPPETEADGFFVAALGRRA